MRTSTLTPHGSLTANWPTLSRLGRIGGAQGQRGAPGPPGGGYLGPRESPHAFTAVATSIFGDSKNSSVVHMHASGLKPATGF